eukprot:jgi/Mesen1/2577/ME000162S01703
MQFARLHSQSRSRRGALVIAENRATIPVFAKLRQYSGAASGGPPDGDGEYEDLHSLMSKLQVAPDPGLSAPAAAATASFCAENMRGGIASPLTPGHDFGMAAGGGEEEEEQEGMAAGAWEEGQEGQVLEGREGQEGQEGQEGEEGEEWEEEEEEEEYDEQGVLGPMAAQLEGAPRKMQKFLLQKMLKVRPMPKQSVANLRNVVGSRHPHNTVKATFKALSLIWGFGGDQAGARLTSPSEHLAAMQASSS